MKKNRPVLSEIIVLKGMAIVCVVLFHMYPPLPKGGYFWGYFWDIIIKFQMPVFMFASGFLYRFTDSEILSKSDYYAFVKKKFKRLMIPYLTISVTILLIKYLVGFYVILKNPVDHNFWKYILFHPEGGFATFLWFIYVLFIIFMIFPIMNKCSRNPYILFSLILVIFFIPVPKHVYFNLDLVRTFLIYFYIGYLFSKNQGHILNIKPKYLCFFSVMAFGILYFEQSLIWKTFGYPFVHRLTSLLLGIMGILSLYYFSIILAKKKNKLFYIFNFLGLYTAGIYLLHTIPMGLVSLCIQQYFGSSGYFSPLNVSLIFISGTMIPILVLKYIIYKSSTLSFLFVGVNRQPDKKY